MNIPHPKADGIYNQTLNVCAAWTIDACMDYKISEADISAWGGNGNCSSTTYCVIEIIGLEAENE